MRAIPALWSDDDLDLAQVFALAEKFDENLIQTLLQSPSLKAHFFAQVGEAYIFKLRDFRFFLEENKVANSFTAFKNRIGLSDNKGFLNLKGEVVLDFPYKDCLLAGGQRTEDGTDYCYNIENANIERKKRQEIFFNRVLAKDEIDRLLDPKALIHWKKFDEKGENRAEPEDLKQDENGEIKQNLIIKGNNLLALHSLKRQFKGKVKLIYIDPPYNTSNDSFKYNDKFNHSTWLAFMKNRLEIAKELLRDDGVIFVQCDDNEQAYLKVLMDEIFGRESFISTFVWEKKSGRQNDARFYSINHEYILNYGKDKEKYKPNLLERTDEMLSNYKNPDNDPRGLWTSITLQAKSGTKDSRYKITFPNGVEWEAPIGTYPRFSKEKLLDLYSDGRLYFGNKGKNKPRLKKFLVDVKQGVISNTLLFTSDVSNTQKAKTELLQLFGNNVFDTPKPEKLIEYLMGLSTQPNDLVLDFFLGSGTTCAVAHKMGRQYIGIEQMDYIETIAVERLKKVIIGEQGGISKAVNWQGGGEFLYTELAELNEQAKSIIEQAESTEALTQFFHQLYDDYFLHYNLATKDFVENTLKDEAFLNLPLAKQKEIFAQMLDNNQLYILKTEMEDKQFNLSLQDKEMTNAFYGEGK